MIRNNVAIDTTVPRAELSAFQGDLKKPNPREIADLAERIRKHGFSAPVFVWHGSTLILDGHQRQKALELLATEGEFLPEDRVPVVYVKAETEQEARMRVAEFNSKFSDIDLAFAIEFFKGVDVSLLPIVGTDVIELDLEIQKVDAQELDESGESVSVDTEPVVRKGDVFRVGPHRIMCGDSLSVSDVAALMDGAEADLLLTDPPYNVAYQGKTKDALVIENDDMDDEQFLQFLRDAFASAHTFLAPGGGFYVWHADSEGYAFRRALHETGLRVRQCLVWNKNSMVMGRQDYQWKHEPCLYGWKEGGAHYFTDERTHTTVLEFDKPSRNGEHPTMKPVALFQYQIENSTKRGGKVLDLFLGSGTSLVASQNCGRVCYGMELDPHYVEVALKRYAESFDGDIECLNRDFELTFAL